MIFKNVKFLTVLLAIALLIGVNIFYACKKDIVSDTIVSDTTEHPAKASMSSELQRLYQQLPTPNFGNIRLVNGDILKFESAEHYEQVYAALNNLCEAWTKLFLDNYDTGNEEALDAIIETLGFDERLPLIKFEEKYKGVINTLLAVSIEKEEQWLRRGGGDEPPTDEITECPIEQTLLSRYHEYCIGDTILQLRPDGYQILVPVSELSFLKALRNTSITELLGKDTIPPGNPYPPGWIVLVDPPVTVVTPDVDCKSHFKNSDTCYNGDNYKFKWFYKYYNFFTSTTYAMKNYKLKNGKWKKDYGSFGRVSFGTQLYWNCGDSHENCCKKDDMITWAGDNLKTFWRGNVVFRPWDWIIRNRCNPDESFMICRHKGTDFKINVVTRTYVII